MGSTFVCRNGLHGRGTSHGSAERPDVLPGELRNDGGFPNRRPSCRSTLLQRFTGFALADRRGAARSRACRGYSPAFVHRIISSGGRRQGASRAAPAPALFGYFPIFTLRLSDLIAVFSSCYRRRRRTCGLLPQPFLTGLPGWRSTSCVADRNLENRTGPK